MVDEAREALKHAEAILDAHARSLPLFRLSRDTATLRVLSVCELLYQELPKRQAATATGGYLLASHLFDGLAYVLRWINSYCPTTAEPQYEPLETAVADAANALKWGADYSALADAHKSYWSGLFKLQYDADAERFGFDFVDAKYKTRLLATEAYRGQTHWNRIDPEPVLDLMGPEVLRHARRVSRLEVAVDWPRLLNRRTLEGVQLSLEQVKHQALPTTWRLYDYTMADLWNAWGAIYAIGFASFIVTVLLPASDGEGFPLGSCTVVLSRDEWCEWLGSISGLAPPSVRSILEDMTCDVAATNDEPLIQPFIPLSDGRLALSAACVVCGDPEHNVVRVICRTNGRRRAAYDSLKNEKELLFLAELEREAEGHGLTCRANVTTSQGQIDALIWDTSSGTLLVVELKWLLIARRIHEIRENDAQYRHGIEQVQRSMDFLDSMKRQSPQLIWAGIPLEQVKHILGIVVSYEEPGWDVNTNPAVPVVEWPFFRDTLKSQPSCDLATVHAICRTRPDLEAIACAVSEGHDCIRHGRYTYDLPSVLLDPEKLPAHLTILKKYG